MPYLVLRQLSVWLVLLLFSSLDMVASTQAAPPVEHGFNFQAADSEVFVQYRSWVPEGFDTLKGLIVMLPGSRGDARGTVGNSLWQFRLSQMGYGIVGFRDVLDFGFDYWGSNDSEVRSNFQAVLDSIAEAHGHPEISNAPILLDGVSKGGFAAGYLASFVPERTLGFISDKGYAFGTLDSNQYTAPGLIIAGDRDTVVSPQGLYNSFEFSRLADANSAYLVEWRTTHRETTENLRLAAMDQMMRARYPVGRLPSKLLNDPLELNKPTGWLAEASPFEIGTGQIFNPNPLVTPKADYPLDPLMASWLPTETMTKIYLAQNENTFQGARVQLNVLSPFNGQIQLSLGVTSLVSHRLELFHEDELIGVFDPSGGPIQFTYYPKTNGLHTFIAVAAYEQNGVMKTTANYVATVAQGVVTVPEPCSAILSSLAALVLCWSSRHLGAMSY